MKHPQRWPDLPPREAMMHHAVARAFLRCGIALSVGDYNEACRDVSKRQGEAIAEGYANRCFIPCRIRGAKTIAVYDREHDCIASFVPALPQSARPIKREAA